MEGSKVEGSVGAEHLSFLYSAVYCFARTFASAYDERINCLCYDKYFYYARDVLASFCQQFALVSPYLVKNTSSDRLGMQLRQWLCQSKWNTLIQKMQMCLWKDSIKARKGHARALCVPFNLPSACLLITALACPCRTLF